MAGKRVSVSCGSCDGSVAMGDRFCASCGTPVSDDLTRALDARAAELQEHEEEVSARAEQPSSGDNTRIRMGMAVLVLAGLLHVGLAFADSEAVGRSARASLDQLAELANDDVVTIWGSSMTVADARVMLQAAPQQVAVQHAGIAGLLAWLLWRGRRAAQPTLLAAAAAYGVLQLFLIGVGFALLRWFAVLILLAGALAAYRSLRERFEHRGSRSGSTAEAPAEPAAVTCLHCKTSCHERDRFCRECGERLSERGPVSVKRGAQSTGGPVSAQRAAAPVDPAVLLPAIGLFVVSGVALKLTELGFPGRTPRDYSASIAIDLALVLVWVLFDRRWIGPTPASVTRAPFWAWAIAIATVGIGAWVSLRFSAVLDETWGALPWFQARGWSTGLALLFSVGLPVVASEVLFRGYIFGRFAAVFGFHAANLAQTALYAVLLPASGILPGIAVGLALGFLRQQSRGIAVPLLVNALAYAAAALFG